MIYISIDLNKVLNNYIDEQVKLGKVTSKEELIHRAIIKYKKDEFINTILQAEQEVKDGLELKGDLDVLAKGFE